MLISRMMVLVGLLGVACGKDEPTPDGEVTVTDKDGDGFPSDVDCDDDVAEINPSASELCDAIDNDCDGEVDEIGAEGGSEFYADFDRDGFGVFAYPILACALPDGYAELSGDCDDFNPDVNPDAVEICNGIDDDCDDSADGAYAEGQNTYYRDADGDGFGNLDSPTTGCTAPVGYVLDVGDCDDTDDTVYEGAAEICEDGLDNNCNGLLDETCPFYLTTDSDILIVAEAWYDRAGDTLSAGGDLNGDGHPDLVIGASQSDTAFINGGAAYVLYGPLTAADPGDGTVPQINLADADATLLGASSSDYAGSRLWLGRDVDSDGYDELLMGAYLGGSSSHGEAYLFHGPLTGARVGAGTADAIFTADPAEAYGALGQYVLQIVGDANNDGVADISIGDHRYGGLAGSSAGRIYLFDGASSGNVQVDDAFATVTGPVGNAWVGYGAAATRPDQAAADYNADGVFDLAVGVPGEDLAWIFYGPLSGDLTATDADVVFTGPASDRLGSNAAAGDQNGDGYTDLALGCDYQDDGGDRSGTIYVFNGPISADRAYDSADPGAFADFATWETEQLVYLGAAANGLAFVDLDGDGNDDLFAGSYNNEDYRNTAGAAFLYFGPLSGRRSVWEADRTIRGDGNTDNAGYGVGAADLTGDGLVDLLVGAEGWSIEQGAVGLFSGARLF